MSDAGMTGEALPALSRVGDLALRRGAGEFPEPVLRAAALATLDTLGIVIASTPMEAGVIAREAACLLYGAGPGSIAARMLVDGRRVSLAGAAFAAATQTDNLDGHDGYNPTKGHIGVVAIPALAALAEGLPDRAGRDRAARDGERLPHLGRVERAWRGSDGGAPAWDVAGADARGAGDRRISRAAQPDDA